MFSEVEKMKVDSQNSNVLFGKKNLNCLSCGRGNDSSSKIVKGTDGGVYRGGQVGYKHHKNMASDIYSNNYEIGLDFYSHQKESDRVRQNKKKTLLSKSNNLIQRRSSTSHRKKRELSQVQFHN